LSAARHGRLPDSAVLAAAPRPAGCGPAAAAEVLVICLGKGGARGAADAGVAQVHGYTTAFWWASAIFCFGAVVAAVLFRWGPLATQGQPGAVESVGAKAQGFPEPGAVPG
jgi:hypothetical protein